MPEPGNTFATISDAFTAPANVTSLDDLIGLMNNTPAMLAIIGHYWDAPNQLTLNLLKGRVDAPNSAFLIQQSVAQVSEAIDGNPKWATTAGGSAFNVTKTGESTPRAYATAKYTEQTFVTKEALSTYRRDAIHTATLQVTNDMSNAVDAQTIAAIVADIPATGGSARGGGSRAPSTGSGPPSRALWPFV